MSLSAVAFSRGSESAEAPARILPAPACTLHRLLLRLFFRLSTTPCKCVVAKSWSEHANTAKPPSLSPVHVHILIHTRGASAPQQVSGPTSPSCEKNRKHSVFSSCGRVPPHGIALTFGCKTRVRAWARTLSEMTSFETFQLYYGKFTHEHERTGSFIWVRGCQLRLAVLLCVLSTCGRKANM